MTSSGMKGIDLGGAHVPAQKITTVLLNGKNFPSWSRSVRLYLGSRGKGAWLLGTVKTPDAKEIEKFTQWDIDNCTILGWLFNSMEERIYNMFMFHDSVATLWEALTRTYSHGKNDARIFELYREVSHASQVSLGLSVADYFIYLQTRWEELAHYEPLTEFPTDAATLVQSRIDRQHTYQFLMGLRPEFEALHT